jgi:hypothetical protein
MRVLGPDGRWGWMGSSDDLDRVLTDTAVELGDEVAAQTRDICRKIGLCD